MSHLPSAVLSAVADPKCAPTASLEAAVSHVDDIDPDDFGLIAEEFARRGGDPDLAAGYFSEYE